LPSATNAVLKLSNVTANQAGQYTVTVANILGATNTAAALSVYSTAAATMAPAIAPSRGQFAVAISGVTGYKYVVQVSSNLVNWVSVQTNTAPFKFVDSNAGRFSQRYYRSFYLH
jgi:DNA-binding beta-propeller fold protein YncE